MEVIEESASRTLIARSDDMVAELNKCLVNFD